MSKKKELIAAIKTLDTDELWKCLTDSSFFVYESFQSNTPTKILIGDFLFQLREKNEISEEELLWVLTSKNVHGENWLHTLANDSPDVINWLFRFLHALAKKELVALNKLLSLLFLSQSNNLSFAMLIAKKDRDCAHFLIGFLRYLGENIAKHDFAASIEINFKYSTGGDTLCHMLAKSDNGNEPVVFASFFKFCLSQTIISGAQFLALVSIINDEHQSVLDIIATNNNQLGFTEICKVLALALELSPLTLKDILQLLANKSHGTSLIEKLFIKDQEQNAIIFPILQKMLDGDSTCFLQTLHVFLPLVPIWRPTDDCAWFNNLYHYLLTIINSCLQRNAITDISFLKTIFLGENGIAHLFLIARSTKNLMGLIIMMIERLFFYVDPKADLTKARLDDETMKISLADFLERLLSVPKNLWTVFDITARYQTDRINYTFLGILSRLIDKMKATLIDQAIGKEGNELTETQNKIKKLQQFFEPRLTFTKGKPAYLLILIKQKSFAALQRQLEMTTSNIFAKRELLNGVLFILARFFPNKFESSNHYKEWTENFIVQLIERLFVYHQTLDSAELECLSLLADKGFTSANYFLYRIPNSQKQSFYFRRVAGNYPLLLIDQALQESRSRSSTKTATTSLCRTYKSAEAFHDCISRYRDLHYLTEQEYCLLLENVTSYYGLVIQFYAGLLYYTQKNLELASSKFDRIPINERHLSANQYKQLVHFYYHLFKHSKDFKYFYIAVRHGLLASQCSPPISLESFLTPLLEEYIFIAHMISWITSNATLNSAFENLSFVIIKELNKTPKAMIELCKLITEWSVCPVIKKVEDEINGYIATELKSSSAGFSRFFTSGSDLVGALRQLFVALKANSSLICGSRQHYSGSRY